MSYYRSGGGVTATGGIARESQRTWEMKTEKTVSRTDYGAIVLMVLLIPAWLVQAGN